MMLLALLVAAAPVAETPKAYMERLYASYRNPNFNPFDHPERYFAPKLMAAIKEDARLAHGEVGYVDGDPICQCQDPDGLHASVTTVTSERPRQSDRPRRDRLHRRQAAPHHIHLGPDLCRLAHRRRIVRR